MFYKLLTHLHSTYNKDSADSLQLLSATIEFLRLLLAENSEEESEFVRTYTLTVPELRKFINWTMRDECHPLYELEKLLEVSALYSIFHILCLFSHLGLGNNASHCCHQLTYIFETGISWR